MSSTPASQRYQETLRSLSDRIVEAQRPIRILDAIKWDGGVQEAFFRGGFREQPPVDLFWYDGGMRPPTPDELDEDGREMPKAGMRANMRTMRSVCSKTSTAKCENV